MTWTFQGSTKGGGVSADTCNSSLKLTNLISFGVFQNFLTMRASAGFEPSNLGSTIDLVKQFTNNPKFEDSNPVV